MKYTPFTILAIAIGCMTVPLFAQQPPRRSLLLQTNNVTMDQLARTGFVLADDHPRQTLKGYHTVVLKDLDVGSQSCTTRDVLVQKEAP